MSETITITINGREIPAEPGTTILRAAQSANIYIPTLCDNDELHPYGSCRLCMVEIAQKNRTRMVASCIYEVAPGLDIQTETPRVQNVRRLVIELLIGRNPYSSKLKEIAARMGISKSRFELEQKGCILCGQCVRVCREVVGVNAIGYKGRGYTREVTTPFEGPAIDCIACGSCSQICPVDVIPMKQKDGIRTIWDTEFPMQKCKSCGREIAPIKQLEYFQTKFKLPENQFDTCIHCR
ncbi:MAG: 2Fe-2S iron-sulfur cluster-binding protein [bacterium]